MLDFIQQKIQEDKTFARVGILDSLAQQFREAPDLSTVMSQLTEKASSLTDEAQKQAGDLYVKYGQKGVEKVGCFEFMSFEMEQAFTVISFAKLMASKLHQVIEMAKINAAIGKVLLLA